MNRGKEYEEFKEFRESKEFQESKESKDIKEYIICDWWKQRSCIYSHDPEQKL